jgi:hypothetical protein
MSLFLCVYVFACVTPSSPSSKESLKEFEKRGLQLGVRLLRC